MINAIDPCSVCGARVQQKTITYTQELEGTVYVVRDVPAQVCSQCGEVYLTPHTVDALQAMIETGTATEVLEVPVFRFPLTA